MDGLNNGDNLIREDHIDEFVALLASGRWPDAGESFRLEWLDGEEAEAVRLRYFSPWTLKPPVSSD